VDVGALAKQQKLSIETAARHARHKFFAELSGRLRCRQIILGHHADDRVESTLINLFRGSGKLTLAKSPSVIKVGRRSLSFFRPLYPVWRSEIDAYVKACGLVFREDASNAESDVTRNRVRHELVPLLDDIFERDVAKIIQRASLITSEEDDYLQALLQELELSPSTGKFPSSISTTRLKALPLTLQRRAIHDWLKRSAVTKISFEKIEECLSLLDTASGPAKINLPGKRHARRRNKMLFIE
jgi:tRNA(Ile)-lysidine synthase